MRLRTLPPELLSHPAEAPGVEGPAPERRGQRPLEVRAGGSGSLRVLEEVDHVPLLGRVLRKRHLAEVEDASGEREHAAALPVVDQWVYERSGRAEAEGVPPLRAGNDKRGVVEEAPEELAVARRDRPEPPGARVEEQTVPEPDEHPLSLEALGEPGCVPCPRCEAVSYTHLRAHETRHDLVCR